MDIGGGSNEFVIANHDQIFWKKAIRWVWPGCLNVSKPSDPISIEEIEFISITWKKNLWTCSRNSKTLH